MKINKETILKLNPLFQAIAEGKAIQVESGDDWMDIDFGGEGVNASTLITCPECYRIKPEPKYRPFKDAEECWVEMLNHQPFGWVVGRKDGVMHLIRGLEYVSVYTSIQYSFKDAFDKFAFADLVPFGVKIDE